ncbi:MAG: BrnA antitoxin family protein [Candidatus Obscuribacterales bacterium]|nr:BrnA antitoxin family protein [Candidatus Obscuribacterales bacterium]
MYIFRTHHGKYEARRLVFAQGVEHADRALFRGHPYIQVAGRRRVTIVRADCDLVVGGMYPDARNQDQMLVLGVTLDVFTVVCTIVNTGVNPRIDLDVSEDEIMASKSKKSELQKPAKQAGKQAKRKKEWEEDVVIPDGKTTITVRFDSDVVEWFKQQGPKYQTRMNQVLRRFMEGKTSNEVDADHERHMALEIQANSQRSQNEYFFALNRLGDYRLGQDNGAKANEYFEQVVDTYNSNKKS